MPDPTPTPAPTPAPGLKPRKAPSDVNQADLAEIKKVCGVAQKAQTAQCVSTLADKGIMQPDMVTLIANCENAETKLAPTAVSATHDKEVAHRPQAGGQRHAPARSARDGGRGPTEVRDD